MLRTEGEKNRGLSPKDNEKIIYVQDAEMRELGFGRTNRRKHCALRLVASWVAMHSVDAIM
jgi:hypothetical protein